jgi:hypothetical protein
MGFSGGNLKEVLVDKNIKGSGRIKKNWGKF